MTEAIRALEAALGHRFADPHLLVAACTHPSVAGRDSAYERLEFLGDRVLGLVVAELLLERFPEEREGALGRRHAQLVRRETLAAAALTIGLDRALVLSPGEAMNGGRANPNMLADALEAVLAALFLDGGMEPARRFIREAWSPLLTGAPPIDPKTRLQEWVLKRGMDLPHYEVLERTGPDHAPEFLVRATVGHASAEARAPARRQAEKLAADALIARLDAP